MCSSHASNAHVVTGQRKKYSGAACYYQEAPDLVRPVRRLGYPHCREYPAQDRRSGPQVHNELRKSQHSHLRPTAESRDQGDGDLDGPRRTVTGVKAQGASRRSSPSDLRREPPLIPSTASPCPSRLLSPPGTLTDCCLANVRLSSRPRAAPENRRRRFISKHAPECTPAPSRPRDPVVTGMTPGLLYGP
jgi:hypothetical protein